MKKNCVLALSAIMILSTFSGISSADSKVIRIVGNNRTATSSMTADLSDDPSIEGYENYKGNYVFANSRSFADALSAYNLVFDKNSRLILIDEKTDIDKYINGANNAYIVGGTGTISNNLERKIRRKFKTVKRYGGSDRYITNSLILDDCSFTKVGIADGRNYPDALAASGYLREMGYGLKLVNGSKKFRLGERYEGVCTFGGIKSVRYGMGERIFGRNRYETSKDINSMFSTKCAAIVYGEDFPDAMAALNVIFRNYQGGEKKPTAVMLSKGKLDYHDELYLATEPEIYLVGGKIRNPFDPSEAEENTLVQKGENATKNTKLKNLINRRNNLELELKKLNSEPTKKLVSKDEQVRLIKDFMDKRSEIEGEQKFYDVMNNTKNASGFLTVYNNPEFISKAEETLEYDNIVKSLNFINLANEKRATENLSPLKVSTQLMYEASLSSGTYLVTKKIGHYYFINVNRFSLAENMAYGYVNPFEGWWDKEKAVYLSGGDGVTGHYTNLNNNTRTITGFSYNPATVNGYQGTHVQEFGSKESSNYLTPDEYLNEIRNIEGLWVKVDNSIEKEKLENKLSKINEEIQKLK